MGFSGAPEQSKSEPFPRVKKIRAPLCEVREFGRGHLPAGANVHNKTAPDRVQYKQKSRTVIGTRHASGIMPV
jgi:hypothetical protein